MTNAITRHLVLAGLLVSVLGVGGAAQSSSSPVLGTVHLARSLMANGQRLAPGTYQVRLSTDVVSPVAGQQGEAWVDFVRGGKVAGRELASVVSDTDIKSVVKGARLAGGEARVEMLREGQYWRVWLHKGANHYLIHLTPAQ
jgi:hypothetical protein